MDKSELEKILSEHKKWIDTNLTEGKQADLLDADLRGADLRSEDLRSADLRGADLRGADLQNADLRGADLDYSCWPLWCGSFDVIVDKKIATQLVYHFCRLICDDEEVKASQKALYPLANQFLRVKECGILGKIEINKKGQN